MFSLNKYLVIAILALLLTLSLSAAAYIRTVNNLRAERDLYAGQVYALQDSVRILYHENDSLTIAARLAMPGEEETDGALDDIYIPEGVDRDDIDQVTEIIYLPKADTLEGEVRGEPVSEGLAFNMRLNIQTHEFDAALYQVDDLLRYSFVFRPKPQKITVLNRRRGVNNERIIYVPGTIVDIRGFDRRSVAADDTRTSRAKINLHGMGHINPQLVLVGVEGGPELRYGPLRVGVAAGIYQTFTPDAPVSGRLLGGTIRLGLSF